MDEKVVVFIPIPSSGKTKRRSQDRLYQRLDCASLLQAHVLHDKAFCVRYLVFLISVFGHILGDLRSFERFLKIFGAFRGNL